MPAWVRVAVGAAVVVAAVVLFVALRSSGDDDTARPSDAMTQAEPRAATGETPDAPAGSASPSDVRHVPIAIPAGGPTRVERIEADRGERIVLVLRSELEDHVHVHGYDLLADVRPGRTSRITVRATIVGRFEIELEDRHVPIAELTVRP